EMRVALSTSKLAVENLRDQLSPGLSEIQERTLVILHSSISRLTRIVDDLLDLAKIEAGKMEIKRELINISDLLEEVIFSQKPKAEAKEIVIVDERKGDLPLIWADKDKIIQVVLNILSNALKFTPKEGKIIVRSQALSAPEGVRIEIIDTGPGIDTQQMEKMFNKFESKNIEDQAGTGLGLSIAKEIVELHRGKIWVESELGKGSTFIIQLPKDLREEQKRDA
ncbi:MAG: HAMP domain-containing sensor histidine kinase, partial [Candidatus Omnitrophota bacterium]